jgi:hypothetical protein
MQTFRFTPVASMLAVALLAACGGGSDTGAEPQVDYLPASMGDRWAYDDGGQTRVTGQTTASGFSWTTLQDTSADGSLSASWRLRRDSQGVYTQGTEPALSDSVSTTLKLPVVAGDRYTSANYRYENNDYDNNGTNDTVDIAVETLVVGHQTVSTPAGTFTNSLQLRQSSTGRITYRPSGVQALYFTGTNDVWLAPDVGPVKEESFFNDVIYGRTTTTRRVLTSYRVGSRSGGTLPGP